METIVEHAQSLVYRLLCLMQAHLPTSESEGSAGNVSASARASLTPAHAGQISQFVIVAF